MRLPYILTIDTPQAANRICDLIQKSWREQSKHRKPMVVELTHETKKRTNAINRLYRAKLRYISEMIQPEGHQYSPDAWHYYFRQEFLGFEDIPGGGQKPISTSELSQVEFMRYLDSITQYCANLGVSIWEE